jgi:hypothetical protein
LNAKLNSTIQHKLNAQTAALHQTLHPRPVFNFGQPLGSFLHASKLKPDHQRDTPLLNVRHQILVQSQ